MKKEKSILGETIHLMLLIFTGSHSKFNVVINHASKPKGFEWGPTIINILNWTMFI